MAGCRFCGAEVQPTWVSCPWCGKSKPLEAKERFDIPTTQTETGFVSECPNCGTPLDSKDNRGLRCSEAGCKERFCESCENWFRAERNDGQHPYCESHWATKKTLLEVSTRFPSTESLMELPSTPIEKEPESQGDLVAIELKGLDSLRIAAQQDALRASEGVASMDGALRCLGSSAETDDEWLTSTTRRAIELREEFVESLRYYAALLMVNEMSEADMWRMKLKHSIQPLIERMDHLHHLCIPKHLTSPFSGIDLIRCPPGTFLMGAPRGEGNEHELPQHEVTFREPFWIGVHPMTQEQWTEVMGENPSEYYNRPNSNKRPVEFISWTDAKAMLSKLNKKEENAGLMGTWRLPTESEWEYACRAGSDTPFNFGETIDTTVANFDGNYPYRDAPKGSFRGETVPVGTFPPNEWGIYGMHDNVWEWCEDSWNEDYFSAPSDGSAWVDSGDTSKKILRGGSWCSPADCCRSSARSWCGSDGRFGCYGVRLVWVPN